MKSDNADKNLEENQCNICLQRFSNAEDVVKHSRVHNTFYLEENASNKITS